MKYRIAIVIPYFGEWPRWINFFVESCRWNRSIQWILFSDQPPPENRAPNVRYIRIALAQYVEMLSDALGVTVGAQSAYKLCDIRPALPFAHRDLLNSFDFVGTGDIDVIYGDIRAFYDDALLAEHDVLSSHADRVSGHFCLMRNQDEVVNAFRQIRGWKKSFERPDYVNFDERAFYNFVAPRGRWLARRTASASIRPFFREAYSTPAATDRMRWYWKDGQLTNEFYPHHPHMYLHFMSWHSSRWLGDQPGADPDAPPPWDLLPDLVRTDWRDARKEGFMISPEGIERPQLRKYP